MLLNYKWRMAQSHGFGAFIAAGFVGVVLVQAVFADEPITVTLKNHVFTPDQVTVAARQRFRITVVNADSGPAEFESDGLRVEKVVVGGGRINVFAGPLKPGTYRFFDDYHRSAQGAVVAVEKKG